MNERVTLENGHIYSVKRKPSLVTCKRIADSDVIEFQSDDDIDGICIELAELDARLHEPCECENCTKIHCEQCEILHINGVKCHETGCPDAWKDEKRECKWCGTDYTPETRFQRCCGHSCGVQYSGVECDCAECDAWREEIRECERCAKDFTPEKRYQYCCSAICENFLHDMELESDYE